MKLRFVLLIITAAACASSEKDGAQTDTGGAAPAPAAVTASLDQFRQLQWIEGRWLGSGGAYPAFYEEYRVVDDSTIQMRAFSDSTFSTATDSSLIELRTGGIRSRSGNSESIVVGLSADSVRFARRGSASGGYTFTRVSADEWRATLHPQSAGGQTTIYVMRRMR
jgi:hypothetical protein